MSVALICGYLLVLVSFISLASIVFHRLPARPNSVSGFKDPRHYRPSTYKEESNRSSKILPRSQTSQDSRVWTTLSYINCTLHFVLRSVYTRGISTLHAIMPQHYSYSYPLANPSSDNESWYPPSAYGSPYTTTFGSPKGGPIPLSSMMSTSSSNSVAQRTTTWQDKLECELLLVTFQHPTHSERKSCAFVPSYTFRKRPMAPESKTASAQIISLCLFLSLNLYLNAMAQLQHPEQ